MQRITFIIQRFLNAVLLASLGLLLKCDSVYANLPTPTGMPGDFKLILSAPGAKLYQKSYAGGSPDFVQVLDLDLGVKIQLMNGGIDDVGFGQGVFGGNDAKFKSKLIQNYWDDLASMSSYPFCVSNGQFFYMREYPTRLPFPLKVDGNILTDGYGEKEYPNQKMMLELWDDHTDIRYLSKENLYGSNAPNILSGLMEDARKNPEKYVGRTFIGIDDRDHDGLYETLLIFNSRSARQIDAADVIRSFGAKKVMMLDGGDSTQLICQNKIYIETERYIPQAIGVIAAGPILEFTILTQTQTPGTPIVTLQLVMKTLGTSKPEVPAQIKPSQTESNIVRKTATARQINAPSVIPKSEKTIEINEEGENEKQNLRDVIWIVLSFLIVIPILYFRIFKKRPTNKS